MSSLPQPIMDSSESALIQRVCAGDRDAFYELVRPHERAIYFSAFSVLNNQADAEEVSQEAVLKAFLNLKSFRGECKFSTWIIQITINEARMKLRKDHRHLYESMDEDNTDDSGDYWPKDYADWRPIPSEALERKELRQALQKGIEALGPKYREVFILRDIQDLSIQETANALGISEANVKVRLLRARLQMRDVLAPGFDGSWNQGKDWEKIRPW